MTNEGQYYSRPQPTNWDHLLNYGSKRLKEAWFKQAVGPSTPAPPADHLVQLLKQFYQKKELYDSIREDYFAAKSVQDQPTKIFVSRLLYASIESMYEFDKQTNMLHFVKDKPVDMLEPHTTLPPIIRSHDDYVYAQIDPERQSLTDYFFQ